MISYFLEATVSWSSNYLSNIYALSPLITERTSLEDVIEIFQLENNKDAVKQFVI